MLLELQRIQVPIGQTLILNDVTWLQFERILEELGEKRSSRIAYHHGRLEIMVPLPEQLIYRRIWRSKLTSPLAPIQKSTQLLLYKNFGVLAKER